MFEQACTLDSDSARQLRAGEEKELKTRNKEQETNLKTASIGGAHRGCQPIPKQGSVGNRRGWEGRYLATRVSLSMKPQQPIPSNLIKEGMDTGQWTGSYSPPPPGLHYATCMTDRGIKSRREV
jgi:hypothetical protein